MKIITLQVDVVKCIKILQLVPYVGDWICKRIWVGYKEELMEKIVTFRCGEGIKTSL